MRSRVSLLVCLVSIAMVAQTATTSADALLQRGIASYRAGHFAEAAKDLKSAADALLSNEQMQTYVASGKFPKIEQFETALVYLTLADEKLGRHEEAKESVLRLMTAERIENVFAKLPLDADAAEFPSLAARLVPGTNLPAQTAQTTTATTPAVTTTAPASEREDRDRAVAEAVAAERARMQKEADERVAQARREAQAQAQAVVVQQQPPLPPTDYLVRLRQADAYADNGQLSRANDMYVAIANAAGAPRDIVAEAAVGLYRTSDFRDALTVLRKLAPFARGEEDLRYYDAVSRYETGDYSGAKRELACALPFIEANEDVDRYRAKIERTAASVR